MAHVHDYLRGIKNRMLPKKAVRVCFIRNKDRFFRGINMAVSLDKYKSMKVLRQAITDSLRQYVHMPSVVASFYRLDGEFVEFMEDFSEGDILVCCCRYEPYTRLKYVVNRSFMKLLRTLIRWEEFQEAGGEYLLQRKRSQKLQMATTTFVEDLDDNEPECCGRQSMSSRCTM
ncbi:hypothetical protein KR018_002858 [Drosophila ironensis]|nr:hypothetical protein KR018_002858 [Drosophila ironensis]